MANRQNTVRYHGPYLSLSTGLGILFIALKLCGVINWPWIWVIAPLWIPWAIVLAVIIGGVIAFAILSWWWDRF